MDPHLAPVNDAGHRPAHHLLVVQPFAMLMAELGQD